VIAGIAVHRPLALIVAIAALLAACADSDDSGETPAPTTTIDAAISAAEPVSDADASQGSGSDTSSPEQPLLDLGFTSEQAGCVIAEAESTGADVLGEVDQELLDLFAACGVSAQQLAAIGLGTSPDEVSQQLELLTAAFTPELQAALRDSDEARGALVDLFVARGLPADASACAVQTLTDLEDLAVLSDVDAVLELFIGCGVSLSDLEGLG